MTVFQLQIYVLMLLHSKLYKIKRKLNSGLRLPLINNGAISISSAFFNKPPWYTQHKLHFEISATRE
jgi:hypothetical protein